MKRHIVCLGDSNTHGYCADPADCADGSLRRFNESERWTCRLQAALGEDFLVLEEGLPGRTTVFDDPVEESLSALPYLYPCLMSHAPVSCIITLSLTWWRTMSTACTTPRWATSCSSTLPRVKFLSDWTKGRSRMAPPFLFCVL